MQLLPDNLESIEITNDVGETTLHIMDKDMIQAVNAALAIGRPLLIWGEPGIGKSQLAKAVAKQLKRAFLHFVADAKTESRDLLWHFDAVARLAEAQIYKTKDDAEKCTDNPLAIEKFIVPGCLWWALNWQTAEHQQVDYCKRKPPIVDKDCSHENGTVLLIDEIDKADSDVPNGLLEALGSSRFQPQGLDAAVECKGIKPLVIITTNEERSLPDAFVRRCLALHLAFPEDGQEDFLVQRARRNFPDLDEKLVLLEAARMLLTDRAHAVKNSLYPLPGQAEYFDLLRGVKNLSQHTKTPAEDYIKQLRRYTYQKHSGFHPPKQHS
jgi:MoxR-like ATPase